MDKTPTHKVVDNMSIAIDGIMECITIDISMDRTKNVLVSCVYRKPDSNMDTFIVNMERLCTTSEQKVRYVCGDFNIDLLNPNKHKKN